MTVAAEADFLFLVVELDFGPSGVIEGEILIIGPIFANVGGLFGIGEHGDVVCPAFGHEELHLLLGRVGIVARGIAIVAATDVAFAQVMAIDVDVPTLFISKH